jgi:hypothetical protein
MMDEARETYGDGEDCCEDEATSDFSFGTALAKIKGGKYVARAGWNGKGMFIFQGLPKVEVNAKVKNGVTAMDAVSYFNIVLDCPHKEIFYSGPVLCMMNAQSQVVVGWLASQIDMLAEDWEEVQITTTAKAE